MSEDREFVDLIRHTISEKKRVIRRFRIWEDAMSALLGDEDLGPRLFPRARKEELFAADPTCTICKQKIADIDDARRSQGGDGKGWSYGRRECCTSAPLLQPREGRSFAALTLPACP
jgi:hypothetical protein